jgi:hypothetical protein
VRAGFLLAVLSFAIAAMPAKADYFVRGDPGCDGREPTAAEIRAERFARVIEERRSYTFRSDPAFVRAIERSATARRRGGRHGFGGALTPSEGRYFDVLRPRVENAAERLRPFERRHRRILGGVSIEDDFRDGPYLTVRLTVSRPARYLPELRRLTGVRVKVVRVKYSEHALERVQDRVGVLSDAPPAGVILVSSSVDIDASRVELQVVTRRPEADVQAEVERRFGPAVRVVVGAAEPFFADCTALDDVQLGADGHELTLRWGASGSTELKRPFLEEGPGVVRVGVFERVPTIGFVTSDLQMKSTVVRLAAPLGQRRLIDAETGRPLEVRRG